MARPKRRKRGKRRNSAQVLMDQLRQFAAGLVNILEELEDVAAELRDEKDRRSAAARRANNTRQELPQDWPWDEDSVLCIVPPTETVH